MNVIEGQANLKKKFSLIFYRLTFNNILNIIVMLILVGVTINVSLNGGLFTKASDASKQMQVEADRETLLSAVVSAIGYDGKVVLDDIELPTDWTGSNGTYTSPKGNTFTVDENGKIIQGEELKTKGLTQIKTGDEWKNVTFASTTLSNAGIELPVDITITKYNNDQILEEPIEYSLPSYTFGVYPEGVDGGQWGINYGQDGDLAYVMITNDLDIPNVYLAAFSNESSVYMEMIEATVDTNKLYIFNTETGELREMTEEDRQNISFSGIVDVSFKSSIGTITGGYFQYDLNQQFANWFTGEVEYAQ